MSSHELCEGSCVELASRGLKSTDQTLSVLKDFIGDGDGSFHTKSITPWALMSRRAVWIILVIYLRVLNIPQ